MLLPQGQPPLPHIQNQVMINFSSRINDMPNKKPLSLWTLTALVAGNMIGSGIFLLPADLAKVGSITLLSWVFTAVGAFFLAILFSRLSKLHPHTGGPYVFAKLGLGRFFGFQTLYCYWIAIWAGNAAIALAGVSYASVFFPSLADPLSGALATILVIWCFTGINLLGLKEAGFVQLITLGLKLLPLFAIAILGWQHFHKAYLVSTLNLTNGSNFHALSNGAALTLWAFIGVESATVPAESAQNPKRDIPLATLLGTLIASVVYISTSTAIMGMIPASELANSLSPFADAAFFLFGTWGKIIIALGAMISCFGCLNGWVLLQGQIVLAGAKDGYFPMIFSKCTNRGVPGIALTVTSILISLLLLLTVSDTLIESFHFIILLTVLSQLIPYVYTALGAFKLDKSPIAYFISTIALLYSLWAIAGTGVDIIINGGLLLLAIILLYLLVYKKRQQTC